MSEEDSTDILHEETVEEDKQEEIMEVRIKKEETKPDPDFDYDSDDLSDKDIETLEAEIDQSIKKRVNKDTI